MFLLFFNPNCMKMSKKFWAVIPLSLLMLTACGSAPTDTKPVSDTSAPAKTAEVTPFVSTEGNFSINFPGKPEVASNDLSGDNGTKYKMTSYSYSPDDNHAFLVAYTDIGAKEISMDDARKVLKDEQTGAFGSFGIKAADEEKQSDYVGKYAGLRYKASGTDGTHLVAQTYIVGTRMYQIEMLATDTYPTDEAINNFTGSFKLLK